MHWAKATAPVCDEPDEPDEEVDEDEEDAGSVPPPQAARKMARPTNRAASGAVRRR
jgi:hypothetical protein